MTAAAHTPLPWHVYKSMFNPKKSFRYPGIESIVGESIVCYGDEGEKETGIRGESVEEAAANAAFIVEACNSHAALVSRVAELEGALRVLFGSGIDQELIGWRGLAKTDVGRIFACEYCHAEHLDCTLIAHTAECPVTICRAALASKEQGK